MIVLRNIVLLIILSIISYTDLKRQEIDNEPIIFGLIFIALFSLSGFNDVSVKSSIIGFLLGGIAFTILAVFGTMGGGDIKTIAMLGFYFGWKSTVLLIWLSFLVGTVFSIFYMIFKKVKLKDHIPFGPSIAIAAAIVLFCGQSIINHYDVFWFLR